MKTIANSPALSAVLGCLLLAGCSKPQELKLRWEPGKQYLEQITMSQEMGFSAPGSSKPTVRQTEMRQKFSLSVLKQRPEGGVEIELKFLSLKISSEMAGRPSISFDSASDAASDATNSIASALRKVVGSHVRLFTDASGKAEKIEGFEKFLAGVNANASPQVQAIVKGIFTEDTLKQFIARGQGLPDKPVKIGDTWSSTIDITPGQMGTLDMKINYKFAGWEEHNSHHCTLLTYDGDITTRAASAGSITVDQGKITGKSWFDPAIGMMVDGVTDQSMTLKAAGKGQNADARMKQQTDMKLLDIIDIPK